MSSEKPWKVNIDYFHRTYQNRYGPSRTKWKNARRKHWLRKIKESKGCSHCGIKDSRVLTFDHIDLTTKSFSIGHGKKYAEVSLKTLIEEVRKCDVLCQNCHTIKTEECKDHTSLTHCEQGKYLDFVNYQLWKRGK